MMIAWMTYCSVIAAFTVAAAALLEPLVRARRLPLRAVWVAAIGASVAAAGWGTRPTARGPLVVPATGGVNGDATRTAPDVVPTAGSPETAPRTRMSTPVTGAVAAVLRSRTTDLALAALWAATSLLAIATLLHSAHRLRRMRRGWREGLFEDTTVLVSDDIGPAVVGLIHPRIVVPAWALGIEGDARRLILSHEREHIRAGDGRLLVAVAVLVRLLPWCLPLWFGERRLRDAIELDCDRRVLRDRADRRRYCALLLDVGARTLSGTAPVPALAEPAKGLERRIDAMTMGARVTTRVLGAAVAGGLLVAGACAVAPPGASPFARLASPAPATRTSISVAAPGATTASRRDTFDLATVSARAKRLESIADSVVQASYPGVRSRAAGTPAFLGLVLDTLDRVVRHGVSFDPALPSELAPALMAMRLDTISARTREVGMAAHPRWNLTVGHVVEGPGPVHGTTEMRAWHLDTLARRATTTQLQHAADSVARARTPEAFAPHDGQFDIAVLFDSTGALLGYSARAVDGASSADRMTAERYFRTEMRDPTITLAAKGMSAVAGADHQIQRLVAWGVLR